MNIIWHGDEFEEQLHTKMGVALDLTAGRIETDAKEICPVLSGALQRSIRHETDTMDLKADIGSDLEYALYQEEGTRYMQAANGGRGFLKPALYEVNVEQYFSDLI
jgi:hypothetical protein